MEINAFEDMLLKTFKDNKLSRTEKTALDKVVDEFRDNKHKREYFRHCAFDIARRASQSYNMQDTIDWLEEVIKIIDKNPATSKSPDAYFSPGEDCLNTILFLLKSARTSIEICVFTITDDRISWEIGRAHQRKVKVRVITDNDKMEDLGSDIDKLVKLGVPVVIDKTNKHMHHKFAIFDQQTLINGSYNWTRSACRQQENITLNYNPQLIATYLKEFERLWRALYEIP